MNRYSLRQALLAVLLIMISFVFVHTVIAQPSGQNQATPDTQRSKPVSEQLTTTAQANPLVPEIECIGLARQPAACDSLINYSELFFFRLKEWDERFSDPSKIVLYINDIPLPYYSCSGVNKESRKIFFSVKLRKDIGTTSQKTIIELIRKDFGSWNNQMDLAIGIGLRDGNLVLSPKYVPFQFYDSGRSLLIAIAALVFFIVALIVLLKKKAINENPKDPRKSLRKFQLVFWTLIIALSYFALWMMLGDAPLLPERVIGLLALSLGTTIVSSYLPPPTPPTGVQNAAPGTPRNQRAWNGLWMDDDDEFAITKLQFLIFTLLFGVIFIYTAFAELRIYDITIQQLILMGVSSAGYLGYKAYKSTRNS